jgi:flagellar biosynthesis protein FlhF
MQIKRYEAKNMTAALRMIKGELGPEAVILAARSIRKGKGLFGSLKYAGVEVTAAIDTQLQSAPNETAADEKAGRDISQNIPAADYPASHQRQDALPAYPSPSRNYQSSRPHQHRVESRTNRAISSLYQQIRAQEVDRGIASELIDEVKRIPDIADLLVNGDLKPHLASILEEMGVWSIRDAVGQTKQNIVALLGATGVGKTTTLAKLAAIQTNRHKKRVALITIDNYGIAANEQLRKYARIIGLPLETALNAAELNRAIKKNSHADIILIDTPGIEPGNQNQILEIKGLLDKIPQLQTHLVMSAATKENDLIALVEALKRIGEQRLVFTKIDESSTFGNLVNVLIRSGLPLSFISCGRKVPDDIEAGSVRKLVDLMFNYKDAGRSNLTDASDINVKKTSETYEPKNKPANFVANKNSDVYHCTDCKWSARIKSDNIIRFNSTGEAEAQNFLPCRSCRPDRRQQGQTGDLTTSRLNLSNYTQHQS